MKNSFPLLAGTLMFALVLSFSCKKIDTSLVGDVLIPAADNVTTFDTVLEVITDNQLLLDSSRLIRTDLHPLGVIQNDPEFGKTKADLYFSLTPDNYGIHPFPKHDSTLVFDSVVLALTYNTIYGDTTSVEKFNVYELDISSDFKNDYYGYKIDTSDFAYSNLLLGSKVVDFTTLNDSVYDRRKTDTIRTKNQLRIKLNTFLANRFNNYDTTNAYRNDSSFRTYFKGLAIKVDEGASPKMGGLSYFDLQNDSTKLLFYYRVMSGASVTDTVVASFSFGAYNYANASLIRRTPGGNYRTYLNNATPNDDKLYIQSSPGSFAKISIPGLSKLSNRIIHRAELSFDILPSIQDNFYTKPDKLFLDAHDTANSRFIGIPYDFTYQDDFTSAMGGYPSNDKYLFNLTRYVQGVVTRKEKDYSLRLSAPFKTNVTELSAAGSMTPYPPEAKTGFSINTKVAAGRVVLSGGSYAVPAKKARLRIVYSKI